ncbi:leucine-rich repeat-containing protein 15-like [Zophobas morio]|uniref:leucine-rich repeat-containing protein 15-like n=1 Tax=Zophobas morio TaxID=2755281 RepID=UPI003083E4A3
MRSLVLNLLVCILFVKVTISENITIENVTVQWYLNDKQMESVATSENLKKIIPDVTQVSVHIFGHVPILYKKSIFGIPNLNRLNLSDVGLEEIELQAFGNLPPLESLLLSWNNLTQIKTDTFSDLNVSNVDLSFNSITLLEPGAFKNFNASIVSLDSNRLTEFLSGVFENVTLGSLSLSDNLLHTIPPTALSSIGLTKLYLFGNNSSICI